MNRLQAFTLREGPGIRTDTTASMGYHPFDGTKSGNFAMRGQIEIATLVMLVAITVIGAASAESQESCESNGKYSELLEALHIKGKFSDPTKCPTIDITWIGEKQIDVKVVGESQWESRGLFNVPWGVRQVAKIKLLEIQSDYCPKQPQGGEALEQNQKCYLIMDTTEYKETKAPLGTWHVTENVPDIFEKLPSAGKGLRISSQNFLD